MKCTALLSKLHNEHMSFNVETEFQNKKLQFNDPEGHQNYVNILQEMIVNKLKLIDSHLSSKKVGSSQLYASPTVSSINVTPKLAQTNQLLANKSKTDNTSVPPGMKEEKIFVTDTMGNKLWDFENN